ncbi:MAG: lipoyl synthase [Bacteroidales bacterium]|nr:MAG: lipoyl synthase [Bacteroidales bacterium]
MSIKKDINHLPRWMKVPLPHGADYSRVNNLIEEHKLNTICSSGNCPNKGECWSAGTATFMILGEKCTRNCRFCFVKSLKPDPVDWGEAERLAKTIKTLALKHCVITSVARDDLEDQGASFWAHTIKTVKQENPQTTMEVLIPDFNNNHGLLDLVINEKPEVISHNIETVERISPQIRSLATYNKSLDVLSYISQSGVITKSGFMLGLGELDEEVLKVMDDLLLAGVKVLTIGQYLPPSELHTKLVEYIKPEIFENYKKIGLSKGFKHVESGPLVRSSYHAERHVNIDF